MSERHFGFPVVTSHELVSCYNCGGDLVGDWWNDTGERHLGMGRYRQACEKCREVTHYDLVKEIEAERGRLDPDLP